MSDQTPLMPFDRRPAIFHIRGVAVILDSDLATALGMETKRLNERIQRNAALVDDRHCFVLTAEEFAGLRSQIATSNSDRGGRRHPPRVFTERGIARVPSFLNTPEAHRITDLIIDTFLMVQKQVAAGQRLVAIDHASRYHVDQETAAQGRTLRRRLIKALESLLDTVIDFRTNQTVATTAKDLTAGALENIRERLREKGLENLKLEAETRRILAEAEKIAADVRRADAEIEGLRLDNLTKRIGMVRQLIELQRDLEPAHVVQLLDTFETGRMAGMIETETGRPALLAAPG